MRRTRCKTLQVAASSLLLALSVALLLTGCAVVEPTPTPEPVTLRFALLEQSPERYATWAEEFHQANPHISVEIVPAEGSPIDVAMGPIYYLPFLQEQGGVVSLSPYIEADDSVDLEDYYGGSVELLRQDGEIMGLPADLNLIVTYYNKELFDGVGAPYPQNDWEWDDLLAAANDVRNPVDGVYGFVWGDPTTDNVALAYQNGGWVLDDLRNPTRPTLNDPAVIEALGWYGDLVHVYDVAPDRDEYRAQPFDGISAIGVLTGKVGLWMGWIAERGGSTAASATWTGPWQFEWGMAPPPRRVRAGTLAVVNGYYIAAAGQHPDAAWEWISFLSQQTPEWMLPARRSVLTSDAYERLVGAETVALAQAVLEETELIPPSLAAFLPALGHYAEAVQQVLEGRATAEEALEAAQARAANMRAP